MYITFDHVIKSTSRFLFLVLWNFVWNSGYDSWGEDRGHSQMIKDPSGSITSIQSVLRRKDLEDST